MKSNTNIIKFKVSMFLVNNFFSGTNFFKIKIYLLKSIGYEIGENSKIVGPLFIGRAVNLKIGSNTWVGKNLTIHGNGDVLIGDNCDLAPEITFLTGSHKIGNSERRAGEGISFNYKVGNGNWIGAKSVFINGASIGNSNIVAANSLVTKNFDNDLLILGSPAKVSKILE